MKVDIYIPIFIGDYLRDTTDLTTEEHGAYFLLLMSMWTSGGSLPERKLAAVARVPVDRWPEVWETLSRFFSVEGGRVTQWRLAEELSRAESKREKARENGHAGGRPRTQEQPDGEPRNNRPVNPGGNPRKTSSPSDPRSQTQIPESSGSRGAGFSEPDEPEDTAEPGIVPIPRTATDLIRLFGLLWTGRWNLMFAQKQWDQKTADALLAANKSLAAREQIRPAIQAYLLCEDRQYVEKKHPLSLFERDFDRFRGATAPAKDTGPHYPRLVPLPEAESEGPRRGDPKAAQWAREQLAKQAVTEPPGAA